MAEGANMPLGQNIIRPKGQKTCVHHSREPVRLYCMSCDVLVCVLCVPEFHVHHNFMKLQDVIPDRNNDIIQFIDRTEKIDVPENQHKIDLSREILKEDKEYFAHIDDKLLQQEQTLQNSIDSLIHNIRTSHQKAREENVKKITSYITQLESRSKNLNLKLKECKSVAQSGSDIDVFDTRDEIQTCDPIPVKPKLVKKTFIPNSNPQSCLEEALGKMSNGQTSTARSSVVTTGHPKNPTTDQSGTGQNSPGYHQGRTADSKQDTRIIVQLEYPGHIESICPTSNGDMWTSGYTTARLITKDGPILQEIKYQVYISDIRVSPITNNVWTCSERNWTIMECKPALGTPTVKFSTTATPLSLCCTQDGCILVGMRKQITKFDTEGKVRLTKNPPWYGRPFVRTPYRITECSVTQNIAVADWDQTGDGGEGKPHIMVMDKQLKELFQYTGKVPSSHQRTTKRGSRSFDPRDVRYDTAGNIIIADCDNGCLHLLSGRGEYMRLLHTDSDLVWCIGIDKANVLWVVFGDNTVKLLQYGVVGGST